MKNFLWKILCAFFFVLTLGLYGFFVEKPIFDSSPNREFRSENSPGQLAETTAQIQCDLSEAFVLSEGKSNFRTEILEGRFFLSENPVARILFHVEAMDSIVNSLVRENGAGNADFPSLLSARRDSAQNALRVADLQSPRAFALVRFQKNPNRERFVLFPLAQGETRLIAVSISPTNAENELPGFEKPGLNQTREPPSVHQICIGKDFFRTIPPTKTA